MRVCIPGFALSLQSQEPDGKCWTYREYEYLWPYWNGMNLGTFVKIISVDLWESFKYFNSV